MKAVGFKYLEKKDLDRYKADDGNADAKDPVKKNQKEREDYFKAKDDLDKGKISKEDFQKKEKAVPKKAGAKKRVLADGEKAKVNPITG